MTRDRDENASAEGARSEPQESVAPGGPGSARAGSRNLTEPLLPVIGSEAAPFFEGCRRGELRVQRCRDTGRLLFPPRARSPFGEHRDPEWVTVSGRGSIWSFVVPHPPLLPWFAERAPYNVIVVALEEDPGVRLVGNLVAREGGGIDEVNPTSIEIGAPVRVVFERLTDEIRLPRWVRA